MKRLFIVIFICLFSISVYAEPWIKYNTTTKYVERTFTGDGYKAGICGKNNANILSGYILATSEEYNLAKGSYKKVDVNITGSSRVIDLTQGEIDAILQTKADTLLQSKITSIDNLDITAKDIITALIKVINKRIPSNPISRQELINQIKSDKNL